MSAKAPRSHAPRIEIPAPRDSVALSMSDGAVVGLRRYGEPRGPRIALSHGNGLAIDAYFPFWSLLLDAWDVIVFDIRNHGRNPLHGAGGHHWSQFARDMESIRHGMDAHFGAKPVTGAFHSLAAVAGLLHVLERGPRWQRLVLFDPPVFPRDGHPLQPVEAEHMREMADRARRRQERYREPRLLARQLAARGAFRGWVPGAHHLLARATLRPDAAGAEWVLACPPALEAHVFETNLDAGVWPHLHQPPLPIKLVCADPELEEPRIPALIGRAMAAELPLDYEAIPGTTHFLQIEKPRACLRALERFTTGAVA